MAITLVGILDSTEGTQTIAFAENITDRHFNHENMINTDANENKQGNTSADNKISMNEYFYQRSYKPIFFTCGTAADTAEKSITGTSNWGLSANDLKKIWPLVRVKFTHKNIVGNPTLNINNTGAKPIYYDGSAITSENAWLLNGIVTLMYNGTTGSEYWDFITSDNAQNVGGHTVSTDVPSDAIFTDTWRNVYTDDTSRIGSGTNTKAINYKAGNNITLSYQAAGTGEGQSGSADYFNIVIDATDTNTWRNVYTDDTSRIGTGINTKGINYKAGENITITYKAAGTGEGQSGNANYFNVEISATNTDTKVTQTGISSNEEHAILFKNAVDTSDETNGVKFSNTTNKLVTLNPSTGTITAINFNGKINNHIVDKDVPSNAVFTDTTYLSGNEITIDNTNNHINHNINLSGDFTGTTEGISINGWGGSGSIKIPKINVNEYGHITSVSEQTLSVTFPDAKILSYTSPTYPSSHISNDYQTIINDNQIAVNTTFDTAFNFLDNKIAGLSNEVANDEAVWSQSIEDEPRYYAKSSSGASVTAMTATLVDSRNFAVENNKPINGTKVDVYFSTAHTTETATLNINNTGAFTLIYNDSIFDTTLIEAGTTLALVFDKEYNSNTGCYRVVGGVGSGADPVTTQLITVNNPIGSYVVGDEIEIGTLLETIIRNMLMVVIDVIKTLPTLTWSWTPGTVEVGATMTPSSTGYTQTDGNYKSADPTKYTNTEFDANNGTTGGVLTAGCALGSVTTPSAVTKTSETSNTFTASYTYSNATNVPKMSNGANSSNLITSGSASASKTGYWRYKYFIGGTAYISSGNYSSVFTSKSSLDNIVQLEGQTSKWGWCSTGTTNAGRLKTASGATSLVLVLPYNVGNHAATITNTTFLSQNVKDNWIYQNDITYALDNGTNVTYKVYVIHNAATGLEYTDIQFI